MSKDKFDACLIGVDQDFTFKKLGSKTFDSHPTGFKLYLQWVRKQCDPTVKLVHLVEATGSYHERLAIYLWSEQEFISVVLPNKAKKYNQSLGLKSKNDTIDAFGLGYMACGQDHRRWEAPSKTIYTLRLLTRQIESVSKLITSTTNQLEAFAHGMYQNKTLERMLHKQVKFYQDQKEKLKEQIEEIIKSDSELDARLAKIYSIKGVGMATAAAIISETNCFELFENSAQLVSYAGYDVVENQSGKRMGKTKISKKGNGHIRRALHFPALNVVTHKVGPFKSFYERIYDKSKIKMKAYTAVQKKLLVVIYSLWINNSEFDENYQNPIQSSGDIKKEPSCVSASSKKQTIEKDVAPTSRATQDRHPSKSRSMPSFV